MLQNKNILCWDFTVLFFKKKLDTLFATLFLQTPLVLILCFVTVLFEEAPCKA